MDRRTNFSGFRSTSTPWFYSYNKTALQKAGLLGSDGKPTGLDGIDAFTKMLTEAKAKTHLIPVSENMYSQDPASLWRLWYTFFRQQDGDFLKNGQLSFDDVSNQGTKSLQLIADWAKEGLIPKNTGYSSMVALFSAGRAVFMINGNWEVPTMVDLKKQGKLPFEYGVAALPKFFGNQDTWADSHQLAIPNNEKTPASPEKVAAALKFIAYVVKQVTWAGGDFISPRISRFKRVKSTSRWRLTTSTVRKRPRTSILNRLFQSLVSAVQLLSRSAIFWSPPLTDNFPLIRESSNSPENWKSLRSNSSSKIRQMRKPPA